ncbi:transcription termination factor 1, mitochondrial [Pleurodeles waltl]
MAARGLVQGTATLLLDSVRCSCLLRERTLLNTVACRFFSRPPRAIKKLSKENSSLLDNLINIGVDVQSARKRQPGVLKKMITYEDGLIGFLQAKGASKVFVAGIISRYPRSITRTVEHLEKKWEIWHGILKCDSTILNVLERSPEAFFRSSSIANLEKNVTFLSSLGLTPTDLARLLTKAPRTFSNRMELNQQMVDYLHDMHVSLGGENTEEFVKQILTKNIFVLIQSVKRVKANIEFLQASFRLTDRELLTLLQGQGAEILDLCHMYIKRNFRSIHQKLLPLGCSDEEINSFILRYPALLYLSPKNFTDKIDCLLKTGIEVKQILEKPRVFDVSISTMASRIARLQQIGYNFQSAGVGILDLSKTRFEAKFEKLQ